MKKIFFTGSFFLYATLLFSQPGRKDTVMWFAGKWKDNKTFVIDSTLFGGGASTGTITIQKDSGLKVNTPGNKQWNENIDKQAEEITKEEESVKNNIRQEEGLVQYNLGRAIVKELERIKAEMKNYKAEPSKEEQDQQTLKEKTMEFATTLNNWCSGEGRSDFNEVMNFYQSHRKIKNEHYDLPRPPSANYDCWSCDNAKQQAYYKSVDDYEKLFCKPESDLIRKALSICRNLAVIGRGENNNVIVEGDFNEVVENAFHGSKKNPSKNGPCYGINEYDMWEATHYLVGRICDKADQLLRDYKKDHTTLYPIIKIYLSAHRQAQLLGFNDEADFSSLAQEIEKLYDSLKNRMTKERDYSQIANIPFLLGLQRQMSLLGSSGNARNEIEELLNFCHFKLTIDMDAKIGSEGGYTLAHLKGTAKVVTELDSLKCFKFVLDKSEQAKIKFDILANEIIAPGPHPVYIGSRTAESPMPDLDIHFCNEGNDSIYIYRFVPSDKSGLWSIPGTAPKPLWINGLDGLFQDPRQLAAEAQAVATDYKNDPSKVDDMKKQAAAMQEKLAALQHSGASPSQIAAEMKKLMGQGEQQTQTTLARLSQLKFPVKIFMGNKVLVNESIDAKTINADAARVIIYGFMRIKLEHDPK